MDEYLAWILQTIREDKNIGDWLEGVRYDFARTSINALRHIENGSSVLVCSDKPNRWFVKYITAKVNQDSDRPLLSIIDFDSFFPNFNVFDKNNETSLISDMLDISFTNDYVFWYIGDDKSPYLKISQEKENSILWITNKEIVNSIHLDNDEFLDKKLLDLYSLFNKAITAKIYGEIDLRE